MKESTTYQAILREGREEGRAEARAEARLEGMAEGAKRILLLLGRKRFGPPKAAIKRKIEAITDLDRLDQLDDRVLEAKSWAEVMALP